MGMTYKFPYKESPYIVVPAVRVSQVSQSPGDFRKVVFSGSFGPLRILAVLSRHHVIYLVMFVRSHDEVTTLQNVD